MTVDVRAGAGRAWRFLAPAVPGWVTARLAVAVSFLAAHLIYDHVHPPGVAVARHLDQGLLGWDAEWYLAIADQGYQRLPVVGLRFFPLLPTLIGPLGFVLGGRLDWALLLLSNGGALLLGALLHRLCVLESDDEELGTRAAWLVALTPAAFVLVWGYAEALSGCLAVAAFLALRTQRWWAAAVAGALAGLTRPIGTLLSLPAAVEAARGLRRASLRERAARLAAVVGPAAGAGAYLAWVWARFGDPFLPFTVQQRRDFRGPPDNPVRVLWEAGQRLLDGDLAGNAHHVPWALLLIVLVAVTFRLWPSSYGALAAATLVVALTAKRLGSFERYAFGAFPVVMTLAALAARRSVERAVVALGAVAVAVYGTMALLGAYVP